jgi:hypothetical protein
MGEGSMGGSTKVARLAFMWGLIACGAAVSASAQEAQQPTAKAVVPWTQLDRVKSLQQQSSSTIQRRGPYVPERFQHVQPVTVNKMGLNDQHTIVVSTLVLILAGVVVLLLVL